MRLSSVFAAAVLLYSTTVQSQSRIMGFEESHATKQLEWEKKFDALLSAANQDEWMKYLTSHPHHVGSPQGKANAEYMAALLKSWGYETELSTYQVLFPTPKTRVLELTGPKAFKARLDEPVLAQDHTSGQKAEQLPPYNAFSADGDVTAPLVFVNRGIPADYEELERLGINVKGKIVIAKYGGSWRGIKPKVAAEHGAIGCIIYSDPADDGFTQGDTYPEGGYRPKDGVQRGSVMDMPVYPGDPTTPGYGSTKDAKRIDRKEAITIMKIPVLPISWADAQPLLESLKGAVAPATWRGALPITYHVGPSLEKVHLKLEFNWDIKPLYNVIATLKGSERPDEWVIGGNHHDGWVNGAQDPISGMVAQMEEARAIGELVKQGYRPKRSLVFCAWDGEEPSLIGSTEWVEDHKEELIRKAVAYINSDGNGRGFVNGQGSHTLEPFYNEILDQIQDPQTGVSLKERRYAKNIVDADKSTRSKMLGNKNVKLGALGAGSDYSPFLQHLGISSMNIGFGGEGQGDQYHSVYDSYDFYTRFIDPGFAYCTSLAKLKGRVMMRLADADLLPLDFTAFHRTVNEYANELKALLESSRQETETENRMLRDKLFDLAKDPTKTYGPPAAKPLVPFLDFSKLENSLQLMKSAAEEFQSATKKATALKTEQRQAINEILYKIERSLIAENGLPRRSWYRHLIYAPGYYTGYGVKTLPGIREGIEERNFSEAQEQINRVSAVLELYVQQIRKASEMLQTP